MKALTYGGYVSMDNYGVYVINNEGDNVKLEKELAKLLGSSGVYDISISVEPSKHAGISVFEVEDKHD